MHTPCPPKATFLFYSGIFQVNSVFGVEDHIKVSLTTPFSFPLLSTHLPDPQEILGKISLRGNLHHILEAGVGLYVVLFR